MKIESLMKFYQTYRFYIFPVGVLLSSLVLIVFVIYPTSAKLISGTAVMGDIMNKSNFLETKVMALESYDEVDLSRKVGLALEVYPADRDFGNILGLLQNISANSGFSVSSISLGSSGNAGNAENYGVKLDVKGVKTLVPALINNIENSPRLMKINRMSISILAASGTVEVSLDLGVLYSKLPQSFGAANSPLPELSQKDQDVLASLAGVTIKALGSISQPILSSPRGKANPFE